MIYIYTRFCLPIYYKQYYSIYRKTHYNKLFIDSFEKYLNFIYNTNNIEKQLYYLNNLTSISLKNQLHKNFRWIIFVGKDLSKKYIQKLYNINAEVIIVESYDKGDWATSTAGKKEFIEKSTSLPKENDYITMRLDCDDGLHYLYLKTISDIECKKDTIIGSNYTYYLDMKENQIKYHKVELPYLHSAGLCCKNNNIFLYGDHTKLHLLDNHINIQKYSAYISTGNHTCTNRKLNDTYDIVTSLDELFLKTRVDNTDTVC